MPLTSDSHQPTTPESAPTRAERRAFIVRNALRGLLWFAVILGIMVLFQRYGSDELVAWLEPLTSRPLLMYGIYTASETFGGIIPPEFFMMWALEGNTFWGYTQEVLLMAGLSYLGGILAYGLGDRFSHLAFMQRLLGSKRSQKMVRQYHSYGGILILLASVTPLPFALVSFLSATLEFGFRRYMLFASPRILRFVVYGYIIWQVNHLATAG